MANTAAPIPLISPQLEVPAPAESSSHRWLLWLAGGLTFLIFGVAIGVFSAKFLGQSPVQLPIASYEDCLAAKGSILQESYPATCVTASGTRFTQPISSPSPESVIPTVDSTANWSVYKNDQTGFSLKYPPDKLVSCSYPNTKGLRLWQAPFTCSDGHDIFYEIAVIENLPGEYKEYKKPSSVRNITVNEIKAIEKVYLYEDIDGPLQSLGQSTEILIENNGYTIQIQFLGNSPDKKSLFDQILSTFKFLTDSSSRPVVSTPPANAKITSPLIVKGVVPAGWMFEGVFPIKLVDAKKNLIVQGQGKEAIPGSWSSGKVIEFSATLTFTTASKSGFVVLEKDNPSGLLENNMFFEIPVDF